MPIYLLIVLMKIEVSSLDRAFEKPRSSEKARKRNKGAFMNSQCGCPDTVNQNSSMIYSNSVWSCLAVKCSVMVTKCLLQP